MPETAVGKKLLLSATEVTTLLGLSCAGLYRLCSCGQMGPMPVKLGRRVLWRRVELEDWILAGCPRREQWRAIWRGPGNGEA